MSGFVVADLAAPLLVRATQSATLAALFGGGTAGQLGLLTIWAVFGPRCWTLRLPATLGVAVLLLAGPVSAEVVSSGQTLSQEELAQFKAAEAGHPELMGITAGTVGDSEDWTRAAMITAVGAGCIAVAMATFGFA